MAMLSMFIGLSVSILLGAVFLAGASVGGVAMALRSTKRTSQKL